MIEATIEKLLLMKLHGMAQGLREQDNPEYRDSRLRGKVCPSCR